MLVNATEKTRRCRRLPARGAAGTGRFARDPAEYATATGVRLQVVDGGSDAARLTCPPPQIPPPGAAACARLIISVPGFISFLFFSRAAKKKKGP